jgi:SAM-dependent methyltransferase
MESEQIVIGGSDTCMPLNIRKRIRLIQRWVDLPGCNILDGGCGGGAYVEALCELGAQAEGIDYVQQKVDEWTETHPGDHRVRQGDLTRLDYSDATFDAVLLNEVLEHVPDENGALQEIHRVMRPNSTLVIFSPNRFYPFETHGVISRKTGRGTGVRRTFLLPYLPTSIGSLRFRYPARNYWPHEWRCVVETHGFELLTHSFVWQTFENISGDQPRWAKCLVPVMRKASSAVERIPLLRRFGVSQLIVARRCA